MICHCGIVRADPLNSQTLADVRKLKCEFQHGRDADGKRH